MAFFMHNMASSWDAVMAQMPFGGSGGRFYDEEAALQAALDASRREQQREPKGPPPASQRALRSLPLVKISPQDLVDPVNRECCVCLEAHALNSTAMRLPCAHIFHPDCIRQWLKSSCTCPVCRFELPTDDPGYEQGRIQRMQQRKPRFAKHELSRLPLKRLKELRMNKSYRAVDRQDLIDYLISSGSIEIVATPEPVEYSLRALREMTVSKLRKCMNEEAGVFFDPKDVVEKEDMIRIFLLSGRLLVTAEAPAEAQLDPHSHGPQQQRDDACPANLAPRRGSPPEMEEDGKPPPSGVSRPSVLVETVSADVDIDASGDGQVRGIVTDSQSMQSHLLMEEIAMPATNVETSAAAAAAAASTRTTEDAGDIANEPRQVGAPEPVNVQIPNGKDDHLSSTSEGSSGSERRGQKRPAEASSNDQNDVSSNIQSTFDAMSISDLQSMGQSFSVDLSDCVQREEMIRRLSSSNAFRDNPSIRWEEEEGNIQPELPLFSTWNISELRMAARLVKVDVSDAVLREDVVQVLHQRTIGRPYVTRFLQTLAPLVGLSVSQLRTKARELQIDLSACLEKDDILACIVESQME